MTTQPIVQIKRLENAVDLKLPKYETTMAAGADVRAANAADAPIILRPGERFMVPTVSYTHLTLPTILLV